MKLTDDIVKALQRTIEDGNESVSDFARQANVSANTITKYLRKETAYITDESWRKIHPLIRPFLPRRKSDDAHHRPLDLNTDQKVLLDTFAEIPKDLQKKKLQEIIEIAREHVKDSGPTELAPDQKMLLRAFTDIPPEVQKKILLDFVSLATSHLKQRRVKETAQPQK